MKRPIQRSMKMPVVICLFLLTMMIGSALGQDLNVSPKVNGKTSDSPSYYAMEAESMTLNNYITDARLAASGGVCIKLNTASSGNSTGYATYNFTGTTGTYDLKVWYFDENDGACTFNVYVAGTNIITWIANQQLGSADPVAATRTSQIVTSVLIANGDQIKLEGIQNNQEWGRYDFSEIYSPGYTPPIVSIISPTNNAVFLAGDNVTINATATASAGIKKVAFYQGATVLGEDDTSPYSYIWINPHSGSYALTAKVTDSSDVTVTSNSVNIVVANATGAPFVRFTTPADGATLQNIVAVRATAYDTHLGSTSNGTGIDQIQFYLMSGSKVILSHQEQTATYDWNIDVAGIPSGDYILKAVAIGNFSDTATSQITVHTITNPRVSNNWVLTFSDDFNGVKGTSPDPTKWTLPSFQRRPNGYWDPNNAFIDGKGNLAIRVMQMSPGVYSSACVSSQGTVNDMANVNGAKFSQTYGKFECRAKLPTQPGWWVAFWMMQGNQGSVGNGSVDGAEVDIMESFGWSNRVNHAVIWDGYTGGVSQSSSTSSFQPDIRDGFHVYTLIWDPNMYYFYVDSVEVFRTVGGTSPCNQPGFVQCTGELSTESWAVDRTWANNPALATYPDTFSVDWVRVYQTQGTDVEKSSSVLPDEFELNQNYPNPFNPQTEIQFEIGSPSQIDLSVYNLLGNKVITLAQGFYWQGKYNVRFNASDYASGIYFYQLKTPKQSLTKHCLYIK
jgi:beta-glucanase (GH16 family)